MNYQTGILTDKLLINPGSDLFSQDPAVQVSSAMERFTSVFGIGTGGSTPLQPPGLECHSIKA